MREFKRHDPLFSLCGLNCGLCSMKLGGHCPGCGMGNRSCKLARCSLSHGEVEYCFQCGDYLCEEYEQIDDYDSFISHRNQKADLEKAKRIGMEAYNREQEEKGKILHMLLENYNDGRRKTFYCIAVNLLELDDIYGILEQIRKSTALNTMEMKEKCAYAVKLFQSVAEQRNISLKLRKK